jgi:DNA invertase Pin-like site-specific DNA recombinase
MTDARLRASVLMSEHRKAAIVQSALVATSFISYEHQSNSITTHQCRRLRAHGHAGPGLGQQANGRHQGICQAPWNANRQEYADVGKDGLSAQGREALAEMIRDVQNGQINFSAILLYDVSRWGRFLPPNNAAAYVRMSTEHQQYSTSNQMDVIREYAKRRGMQIVKDYSDEGKSGLNIQGRESLAQMIQDVQDGKINLLVHPRV